MKFESALVTSVSGSIGGMTGSHNAGGMYLRAKSIPVNPNTFAQQQVRANFNELMTAWRDQLTPTQRAGWENYAEITPVPDALGNLRTLQGAAMYVKGNSILLQAGGARADDAPESSGTGGNSIDYFTTEVSVANGITWDLSSFNFWAQNDGGRQIIYMSGGKPLSINFFKGPYRLAGVVEGNTALPPQVGLNVPAIDLPFPIVEGQRYYLRWAATSFDGRPAPANTQGVIAVA